MPIRHFKPDWKRYGRGAARVSNREMADYAGALIAVWDGTSRGTCDMIETARRCGQTVFVHVAGRKQQMTSDLTGREIESRLIDPA